MIHVAYRLWGGDGFYAKMCGTSMLSMFENTKEKVTVHIMHNDRLTPDNRGKFCYIAGQYNQQVEFHNVEEIAGDSLRKFEAAHPLKSGINAAWYPFIVHEVFPNLDKLIFLGTDTIIHLDIAELWDIKLNKDFPFAAVSEFPRWKEDLKPLGRWRDIFGVSMDVYFNGDVFLFNPNVFRENFELILKTCKWAYQQGNGLAEQNVLNHLFSEKFQSLPTKFNFCLRWERELKKMSPYLGEAIYHYAGGAGNKPSLNTDDVYSKLYLEYFLKTPWANVDMFGNIDKAFKRRYDVLKEQFLHYTNFIGKRKRIFLVHKENMDKMRRIFAIKDDELVVDVSDLEARAKFLETANELGGGYLIYMLHDAGAIRPELVKRNLVEGSDFLDARILLSAKDGGKFLVYNSREVLREM